MAGADAPPPKEERKMGKRIGLVPAYGRDYKSKAAVLADLKAGKDFQIADMSNPWDGSYTSISDLGDYDQVSIRYKRLMNQAFFVAGKDY